MSHEFLSLKNKQQKPSKVHFEQYLYNSGEPDDDTAGDLPLELETELLEDSHTMRGQFRHIASRMRKHFS